MRVVSLNHYIPNINVFTSINLIDCCTVHTMLLLYNLHHGKAIFHNLYFQYRQKFVTGFFIKKENVMRGKIREKIMNSDEIEIDLHGMAITDNEINEIINEIIRIRPNARTIILSNNPISDKGAILLGENLAE